MRTMIGGGLAYCPRKIKGKLALLQVILRNNIPRVGKGLLFIWLCSA
ncbi:hypothetical protein ANAPH1_00035 [Anaplasma phagocytophilum]|nr:hypothetical protein ANAPH1_00035 [Anaplasma phagocytophilum]